MPDVKLGIDQISKPAPRQYRLFANAMILFILPGLVTLVQGLGLSPKILNYWMLGLAYAPSVIKGIGMILGNGQFYSDQQPAPDQQKQ